MDFKIYNEKIKPLENEADFDPTDVKGCIIGEDGLYLVPRDRAKLATQKV